MNEKTFNRIFNGFILVGTAAAVITATIVKILEGEASFDWRLALSAFGSIMGILSTVSAANGRMVTFIFGLIDVTLYGVMCWFGENYGNAALHLLYFVPMQVVGLVQWKRRGASRSSELRARRLSPRQRLLAAGVLVAGTAEAPSGLQFEQTNSTLSVESDMRGEGWLQVVSGWESTDGKTAHPMPGCLLTLSGDNSRFLGTLELKPTVWPTAAGWGLRRPVITTGRSRTETGGTPPIGSPVCRSARCVHRGSPPV